MKYIKRFLEFVVYVGLIAIVFRYGVTYLNSQFGIVNATLIGVVCLLGLGYTFDDKFHEEVDKNE